MKKMRKVAIYGKGGIGKSTTTQNTVAGRGQQALGQTLPGLLAEIVAERLFPFAQGRVDEHGRLLLTPVPVHGPGQNAPPEKSQLFQRVFS